MIQSGEYMLSTDFVQNYKKVNFKESTSIWKIIWAPNQATLDDILLIVFDPREFDKKVKNFYNIFYLSLFTCNSLEQISYRYWVEGLRQTNSSQSINVPTVQPPIEGDKSRVGNIIDHIRSKAIPDRKRKGIPDEEDFIKLPISKEEEDGERFFFDTSKTSNVEADLCICPPTLAQMMVIVHNHRQTFEIQMQSPLSKCRVNNYDDFEEA
jgi:hypothetical protein